MNNFWSKHVENITYKQHVITLFRAQTDAGTYFIIGSLFKLNKSDKDFWITFIN